MSTAMVTMAPSEAPTSRPRSLQSSRIELQEPRLAISYLARSCEGLHLSNHLHFNWLKPSAVMTTIVAFNIVV